jgi:protocatechuate 3,4-dioxygenase beta subunit
VDPRAPKTLTGQVVDKEGKGLAQAVVYLKNQRTLAVRTHIADGEGKYRFNGLSPEIDFAVHAEHRGASSPTRSISSFDDKKDVYLVLEIDPARQ